MTDTTTDLAPFARAFAASRQPEATCEALHTLCRERFGCRILTVFRWRDGDEDVRRVWSMDRAVYPYPTLKRMGPTAWGDAVLRRREPWSALTRDAVRAAFFDFDVIDGLGCGACLSVPLVFADETVGAVSILDAEGHYRADDLAPFAALAALAIPAVIP